MISDGTCKVRFIIMAISVGLLLWHLRKGGMFCVLPFSLHSTANPLQNFWQKIHYPVVSKFSRFICKMMLISDRETDSGGLFCQANHHAHM